MLTKETIIECNTCNRQLGIVGEKDTQNNATKLKYKCLCPCGGESFVVKTESDSCFSCCVDLFVNNSHMKNNDYVLIELGIRK